MPEHSKLVDVPLSHGWAVKEVRWLEDLDFLVLLRVERHGSSHDPARPFSRWDVGKRAFIDAPRLQAEVWFDDRLKDLVNETVEAARDGAP